jgi:uncharacterized protein (TIGR03437 family)
MMKNSFVAWVAILGVIAGTAGYGKGLPLLFEEAGEGAFRMRGPGYSVRMDAGGMTLRTDAGESRLQWVANRRGKLAGIGAAARVHYLMGNDEGKWVTGVGAYARVEARGAYPGVDLVYYGSERELEYDFLLAPGADASAIGFRVEGSISADGGMDLSNGMRWKRPAAYQEGREVAVRFVEKGGGVFGFSLGEYDRGKALRIDPVLTYATYIGGSLADDARGVAADGQGNAYVVGSTSSVDFPGTTAGRTFGSQDVYVAKISADGRNLIWATYIGGQSVDTGIGIAVDAAGSAYVTGQTASNNFPVTANVPQRTLGGGSAVTDTFVTKLAPNGASLVYSTYLGGSQSEVGNAIALDRTGAAYIVGRTDSTDFPVTTRDTLPIRGGGDAFVAKIVADGSQWAYVSAIAGFALDVANAVAVDGMGSAYVVGETRSENFPATEGAFQVARRGTSDAFFARMSADGAQLLYASYYGGEGIEIANGVAIDARGQAVFGGVTTSMELPVTFNAAQLRPALLPDAFVARMDPNSRALAFGTYLGGDINDVVNAVALDAAGAVYVAGDTTSVNFPVVNDGPIRSSGFTGGTDGFVAKLNFGGTALQFSSHFGGSGTDSIQSMAVDGRGKIWIAGMTDSGNLPVTAGVIQARNAGAGDGFVALWNEITIAVTPASVTLGPGESQQFTATLTNTANTAVRWSIFPDIGSITQGGLYTAPGQVGVSSIVTVTAVSQADGTKLAQALVTLVNRVTISLAPSAVTLTANQTQQFTATVAGTNNTAVTWTLTPNIGTITPGGLYTAPATLIAPVTVTLQATALVDSSRTARATINLVPPAPPPAPVLTDAGFTNAASFRASLQEGGLAPGELITIFGTNMGPAAALTLQLDGRGFVSNRLGGTRVLFDGTPSPVIVTSAGQVSVVVPYGVEGKQRVDVQVEFEGRISQPVSMPVTNAAPGIFTQNSSGSGPGSIIRQNGQLITAAAPAAVGEALTLFGTGEGATSPPGVDGKPTAAPTPLPRLEVKVVIDGNEITPLYAGGAPGLVAGVLQVNFVVPTLGSGNRRIQIKVGDKLSPDTVLLPVR